MSWYQTYLKFSPKGWKPEERTMKSILKRRVAQSHENSNIHRMGNYFPVSFSHKIFVGQLPDLLFFHILQLVKTNWEIILHDFLHQIKTNLVTHCFSMLRQNHKNLDMGRHRGLAEERSHCAWAAWVFIPLTLQLWFSDFEEQLEDPNTSRKYVRKAEIAEA